MSGKQTRIVETERVMQYERDRTVELVHRLWTRRHDDPQAHSDLRSGLVHARLNRRVWVKLDKLSRYDLRRMHRHMISPRRRRRVETDLARIEARHATDG